MKHRLTIICATLSVILHSATAYARLGETQEQCIQRYGNPVKTGAGSMHFVKDGVVIGCGFDDAKVCDFIVYFKNDGSKFTSEEVIQIIVKINSANGKRKWDMQWPDGDKPSTWKSDDGFIAQHPFENGIRIMRDPGFKPAPSIKGL